MSGNSLTVFEQ